MTFDVSGSMFIEKLQTSNVEHLFISRRTNNGDDTHI